VLSVERVSGSAGPQFNNRARGSLCGPRDPEGSTLRPYQTCQISEKQPTVKNLKNMNRILNVYLLKHKTSFSNDSPQTNIFKFIF